jgi:hypothetical protein
MQTKPVTRIELQRANTPFMRQIPLHREVRVC